MSKVHEMPQRQRERSSEPVETMELLSKYYLFAKRDNREGAGDEMTKEIDIPDVINSRETLLILSL